MASMQYVVLDTNYVEALKNWNQQTTEKTIKIPSSMTFSGRRALNSTTYTKDY